MAEKIKLVLIGIFIALFSASPSGAVVSQSDDPSYTLMATGINYTAYFSPMNTNGFKFVIGDHSFIFLPRSISYTDDSGETSQHLGSAQDTQIQNTSDMIYFENAYGSGGQLRYLSNPLMIKEIYVLNELPTPSGNNDWMTLSSIAAFDNDLKLKYIDDSGVEQSWDGTKIKTNEIKFYDASDKFQFELPQPLAKDTLDNTATGHYLIYEKEGIVYITARFSYAYLANMTLPIYLDISLAEGEVAFGKSDYLMGETLDIWARGFAFSNERTLLYNPSNQAVETFDWPSYADGWTSKYTYVSDASGWWRAELQTRSWLGGEWKGQDTAYAYVKTTATPTPTPSPTPTPTTTVPPQPPSPIKGILYGYITSSTGESLSYVTVTVNTDESTSSGGDNQYVMYASAGWYYVTASLTGYISETKYAYIKDQSSGFTRLDFTIQPAVTPTPTPTPDMTYRGSINMTKDEYYPGDTIEARAINLNTLPEYKIKWYENNVLINPIIQVSGVSDNSTSIQVPADKPIGTEYKVTLTKKDDTVLSSDTARVVGRPSINMAKDEYSPGDWIEANAVNLNPSQEYRIKWYRDDARTGDEILVYRASEKYTSIKVPEDNSAILSVYKVELAKPDGTILSSDTAKIVVDVKIAVILAEPSDDPHNKTQDKNYYLTKIVQDLQGYYKEVSYGAVNITINQSDIYDNYGNWYKLGKTAAYYGKNISDDGSDRSPQFALDAIATSGINVNNYDAVIVVHANASWQQRPNNWELMKTGADGKYILVSESELMGNWAHEIGHRLGTIFQPNKPPYYLPDVYALGFWDLMGAGNWLGDMKNPDHMSSFSKEWLGWLKYKSLYYPNTGAYWINSITTMKYGDEITRYIIEPNPLKYYIIETRTNNPDYSKWDTSVPIPKGYSSALVLYQVESAIDNSTVDFKSALTTNSGSASYWDDYGLKIRFSAIQEKSGTIGSRKSFEIQADISQIDTSNYVGAVYTPDKNLVNNVPSTPSPPLNGDMPYPDTDLHAYTPEGKHVGINYTTGLYENQISGAKTSGDSFNAREWIFVPYNIKVQFTVDSREIGEFLDAYPSIKQQTSGIESYNLSIVYDDPNNIRYAANAGQYIAPYTVKNYNYAIVKNMDGTYKVVLDYMPPLIFNTTPKNATNSSQVLAEFADNPDGSGIDSSSISLIIDGADVTRNAILTDSSISAKPIIKDGLHEVILRVSDKAGNKATTNWNFTLDTAPPEITISNVSALTNQNVSPDIKVIDARDPKPIVGVYLDGADYNGLPVSTEGEHTLRVAASDDIGNTAMQSIKFTIDKTPPSISITGAENDGFYNISKTISYAITDNIDTSPLISANYLSGTVFNDENDYSVQIIATDNADNIAVKTLNFTIDKTPPIVNIASPNNDAYIGGIVKITGTATDIHMKTISLEVDGISTANATEYLWDSTKVTDGEHKVQLNAEDKAGNAASFLIKIKVDNTPPEIFNIIPQDNAVVNSSYSISVDYTDTGSGIDVNTFSILIDSIDETKNALITNASMQYKPSLQDGKHISKLSINDIVGNSRIVTTSFEVDTTPPEVKINFPANNSFVRQTITISGIANDIHLDTVSMEIDGTKVSSMPTYTWDTPLLKDGTHEIKLSAVDTVKNSASASINMIVDNTPPIIQHSPPNGTEFYSDQNLMIDYVATDITSGVASSSVALDDAAVTKNDIIDLRNLSIGSHTIRVNAKDNAGNSAESSTTFIVKPLQAIVEIEPRTLNINSTGRWIQAKIQIIGYNPNQIDISSIRLNGIIPVEIKSNEIEDKDSSKLEVKFNRTQVQSIANVGDITMHVSGKVNGAAFIGNNTIRVIENQKSDVANDDEKPGNNFENDKG